MHGEVSDRREQLVRKVPSRVTTSTARSRYLRDKATTEPEVKVLRGTAYASLKANGCGSGVVRQQGPGQPAHETGALEREVGMSSPSLVGPSGMATGAANQAPGTA